MTIKRPIPATRIGTLLLPDAVTPLGRNPTGRGYLLFENV
jgi:hypothetical protein